MQTLAERNKDLPQGMTLYPPCYGEVTFENITDCNKILGIGYDGFTVRFRPDGSTNQYGECMLFPSKEDRDWDKFLAGRNKFDVRTLQPFDKVLTREDNTEEWKAALFSHYKKEEEEPFCCTIGYWQQCVPYNDDTKHLLGTTEQAPEYYITWKGGIAYEKESNLSDSVGSRLAMDSRYSLCAEVQESVSLQNGACTSVTQKLYTSIEEE